MYPIRHARAGVAAILTLLLTTLLVAASWSTVAAQERDDGLEWAPLVTPPPIVTPPFMSPTDQVDGYAMGDPDAPVVIEVWEDFQCPYCQRFTYEIEPVIVERYVETGEVRLVFRHLAFLGDESHWAAVASSLAADQDMFWPFRDYLFANFRGNESGGFHLDRLLEIGEAVGLDMDRFREGLRLENARERWAEIEAVSRAEAVAQGINATPTVVVNGVPLGSPDFATISDAVDIELAKVATADAGDETVDAEETTTE
ncbi:MAG: thioredoxin domain-containing protein [Candidatus Limnocylindrales bacterium]